MREELGQLAIAHQFYFQLQVGPDGNRWAANAPSTIEAKGHDVVLRGKPSNRQRLSRSLTRKSAGPDAVREVIQVGDNVYAVFGTEVEYSKYHDNPDGRLPFRPHIGVNTKYIERFETRVMNHAMKHLVKRGAA